MTPINLELALSVQQEIVARQEETDKLRSLQVARAQYEADLAAQRYRRVDPNNRLVANTLEAEWNAALRTLQETQQEYDHQRNVGQLVVSEEVQAQVMALTTNFPRVWNDPHTTDQHRKRFVRLLIEDVTLIKKDEITIQVRFRGGATQTLIVLPARRSWETWTTSPEVIQAIDDLLNGHTDQATADILNQRGLRAGKRGMFTGLIVANLRRAYELKSYYERLRVAGMLTVKEIAKSLGISEGRVKVWHKAGLLRGYICDDRGVCLFEPPGPDAPTKIQGRKLATRRRFPTSENIVDRTKEVQYEA